MMTGQRRVRRRGRARASPSRPTWATISGEGKTRKSPPIFIGFEFTYTSIDSLSSQLSIGYSFKSMQNEFVRENGRIQRDLFDIFSELWHWISQPIMAISTDEFIQNIPQLLLY